MRLYSCLLPLPGRIAPLLIGAMLLACLVALKADIVQACCPAGPPGVPVANADQAVIMIWDADNKTQHFIRQASFKTEAADFGFLIPSPTQPELAESGNEAFGFLDRLTQPPPLRNTDGRENKNATPGVAAVTVLERKLVAGFDAAVLEAKSATALVDWLKKNGYAYSPEIKDWAKPYIDAGWKFTALKVAKDKNSKDSKDVAASALRMSFKTDRPLFPYREPDYKNTAASLGAKKRLLRIFFIAEARYQGDLTKETPWTGKVVWAGPIDAAARKTTLEMLKLPETTGPKKWFLTKFDDNWPYKVAPADIYFTRSKDQSEFLGHAHDEPTEMVIGALDGARAAGHRNRHSRSCSIPGRGGNCAVDGDFKRDGVRGLPKDDPFGRSWNVAPRREPSQEQRPSLDGRPARFQQDQADRPFCRNPSGPGYPRATRDAHQHCRGRGLFCRGAGSLGRLAHLRSGRRSCVSQTRHSSARCVGEAPPS